MVGEKDFVRLIKVECKPFNATLLGNWQENITGWTTLASLETYIIAINDKEKKQQSL